MSGTVVHYPETRPVRVGPNAHAFVAACSCGWQASVRHSKRADAVAPAIAHARELNHPRPQEDPHA